MPLYLPFRCTKSWMVKGLVVFLQICQAYIFVHYHLFYISIDLSIDLSLVSTNNLCPGLLLYFYCLGCDQLFRLTVVSEFDRA